jgi:hypothetical protein
LIRLAITINESWSGWGVTECSEYKRFDWH